MHFSSLKGFDVFSTLFPVHTSINLWYGQCKISGVLVCLLACSCAWVDGPTLVPVRICAKGRRIQRRDIFMTFTKI